MHAHLLCVEDGRRETAILQTHFKNWGSSLYLSETSTCVRCKRQHRKGCCWRLSLLVTTNIVSSHGHFHLHYYHHHHAHAHPYSGTAAVICPVKGIVYNVSHHLHQQQMHQTSMQHDLTPVYPSLLSPVSITPLTTREGS